MVHCVVFDSVTPLLLPSLPPRESSHWRPGRHIFVPPIVILGSASPVSIPMSTCTCTSTPPYIPGSEPAHPRRPPPEPPSPPSVSHPNPVPRSLLLACTGAFVESTTARCELPAEPCQVRHAMVSEAVTRAGTEQAKETRAEQIRNLPTYAPPDIPSVGFTWSICAAPDMRDRPRRRWE